MNKVNFKCWSNTVRTEGNGSRLHAIRTIFCHTADSKERAEIVETLQKIAQEHFKDASQAHQEPENNSAFIAAIEYSLKHQDLEFLHAWFHGNFDAIRREWADVPDSVFKGADPLYAPAPAGEKE